MNFSRFEFSLLRVSRFYIVFQDMFGEESVPKIFSGDRITVSVDTRKAVIDLASLEVRYIYPFSRKPSYHLSIQVSCTEDSTFQQIVQTAVSKLHQSLVPLQFDK